MALSVKAAFGAGELDPALRERTTLEKYKTGLATERNGYIGKTGRVISRQGSVFKIATKESTRKCVLFHPLYSGYKVEWGHLYVRIHNLAAGTYVEEAHDWTEDDLPYLHFNYSGAFVYITREDKQFKKMVLGALVPGSFDLATRFVPKARIVFVNNSLPVGSAMTKNATGTGYAVEYTFTLFFKGEESLPLITDTALLVITATTFNEFKLKIPMTSFTTAIPTEMRVYRRPTGGSAYGYIGASAVPTIVGTDYVFTYVDIGAGSDFTHTPPTYNDDYLADRFYTFQLPLTTPPIVLDVDVRPKTSIVYQQSLIISGTTNKEAIFKSRTGFQRNFTRDYPINAASSLTFKSGTTGNANVLRFHDIGALAAWTSVGLYVSAKGALSPANLAMDKKGNWVIDDIVPPLELPGALLFVDKTTNGVVLINYSLEADNYTGDEISIFSNHLFENRRIVAWDFEPGVIPLVWVVFDDGTLASMTYQKEQQMQAWTRHDTRGGLFESLCVVRNLVGKARTYFVVKRGEARYIEYFSERYVKDIKDYIGMDSSVSFKNELTASGAVVNVTPVTPGDWLTELTLTSSTAIFANTAGNGAVGSVFMFFDSTGKGITLTVTAYTSTTVVRVDPSIDFPSAEAGAIKLYKTFSVLTGLNHMEGKSVSVMADGFVVGSPLNKFDPTEYAVPYVVTGGSITLPEPAAIVHVGLPYAWDTETLDVDTVEQSPTLIESKNCSKVYVKVYHSRGLFVGNNFPEDDLVDNTMVDLETMLADNESNINSEAAIKPYTKRFEVVIPGDWSNGGRICLRQVDPLPSEVLSIIPDLDVPRR